jgi:polysaccharide deacetylase family protein (PEP-CTERM system associated)
MPIENFLTIDVEDYFHVSAFEEISPPSTWGQRTSRVERNSQIVLSILDQHQVKATFFVLGWVAERFPQITKEIAAQGHEVASHGYLHQRVALQKRDEYREDIRRSKQVLEDQIGKQIKGYRAPSYSITRQTAWAFDELLEAGFEYDSSIFPIRHDFYGIPDWPRFAGYATETESGWEATSRPDQARKNIREIPITTLRLGSTNLPIAGGGYFRLLPYTLTRWGLKHINDKEQQPFVFYLHPWEFDPQQPRMKGCSSKSRFRHYLNLRRTEKRFSQLVRDFRFTTIENGLNAGVTG